VREDWVNVARTHELGAIKTAFTVVLPAAAPTIVTGTLGPSARLKGGGSGPNGVVSQNETGGNVSKMRGKSLKGETGVVSNRDSNLTIEPKKEPPSRRREAADAERVLSAYPPDRLRGKAACLAQIEESMKEGIAPEELLQAVQRN